MIFLSKENEFGFMPLNLKAECSQPPINESSTSYNTLSHEMNKFTESEVKLVKQFYDTIRMKHDLKSLLGEDGKAFPHFFVNFEGKKPSTPSRPNNESYLNRKRNKYSMFTEDEKEKCISLVKVTFPFTKDSQIGSKRGI